MGTRQRAVATIVLVIVATAAVFLVVTIWPQFQQAVTVAATTLAAVATLLAAINANRAATASEETARQAREALQQALRPTLVVNGWVRANGDGDGEVRVLLVGTTPAVDVEVQFEFDDGQTGSGHANRLSQELGESSALVVALTGRPPARDYDYEVEGFRRATIRFEDERRVGRWRQEWTVDPTEQGDGWVRPARWVAHEPVALDCRSPKRA